MLERFEQQRSDFLRQALQESKQWCVAPDTLVEGKRADQFWLWLFSSPSEKVTCNHVTSFMSGFQLQRAGWDPRS